MSTIVTITFSPCIDKYATVSELRPDSKLNCSTPVLQAGGGGVNVARVIKKLGGDVTAIYPSGGYTGAQFNRLLAKEDIPSLIVETISETRENLIILDETSNRQYRFGMPGSDLKEDEWMHLISALESMTNVKFIVASGSLPPGVPEDIFARIAEYCNEHSINFILDTSGRPLKLALEKKLFLVKPNIRELSSLSGNALVEGDDIWKNALPIIEAEQARAVIISMGDKGAWLVTKESRQLISAPPVLKRSTVGAGDSMVAGATWKLSQGASMEEAAKYGVACGTAATLKPGSELCSKEDADRLFHQILYLESNMAHDRTNHQYYPV